MADTTNPNAPTPNPYVDNKYALQVAPFSQALEPQAYQSTGPKTVSGYGGKGEALAMFADKFLQGVSRGRKTAFDRQEQQRGQLQQNVDQAIKFAESSDASDDVKNKVIGQLTGVKLGQVMKTVDTSKDKDNPQLKGIKGIFDAMLGPRKKDYEFGPEQINAAIANSYATLTAPENTKAGASATLNDQAQAIISKLPPEERTIERLQANKDLNAIASTAVKRGLQIPALDELKKQSETQQKYEHEEKLKDIAAKNAKAERDRESGYRMYVSKHPEESDIPYDKMPEEKILAGMAYAKPAKYKDEEAYNAEGDPIVVKVDTTPGHTGRDSSGKDLFPILYASGKDKDKPVPDDLEVFDKTFKSQQDRQMMWGEFGGYYKAALADFGNVKDVKERERLAREKAAGMVEDKFGLTMGNVQQQMAVRYINTGAEAGSYATKLRSQGVLPPIQTGAAPGPGATPQVTKAPQPPPGQPATGKLPPYQPPNGAQPKPAATSPVTANPKPPAVTTKPAAKPDTTTKTPGSPLEKANPRDREQIRFAESVLNGTTTMPSNRSNFNQLGLQKIEELTGVSDSTIAGRREQLKSDKQALERINLLNESGKGLEKALDRHATVLENLRPKLPDTDITKLNEWLISGAREFNVAGVSDAAAQYGLALQAVRNEYGRVISGGASSVAQTPVEAMKAAGESMRAGFTSGNIKAMLDQMRTEASQKIGGQQEELQELSERIGQGVVPELHGQTYKGPGSTPKPKSTTGAPPQAQSTLPKKLTSKKDYEDLPIGAQYIDADGRVYTKKKK